MIQDPRELKRRLLLRLKGVESVHPLIGPATVQLHLTDLCNLTCRYCYYYGPGVSPRPTGKNHLPFDLFENIVRDCADLQVDIIYLSGQGEPTLHPRFYDMLHYLESSFAITINSNGTFPLERCRDILRANRIVINLGEADRKSYQALQGKDFFVKVIKNIRELSRLRPQFNPDFCIEVVFITTRLNIASLARTENLVKKLGVDVVRKTIGEASEYNRDIMFASKSKNEENIHKWSPCFYGWFYSAIRLNGDVNVCNLTRRSTIGNVYKTSFKDIWDSNAYSFARTSALTGKPFMNSHECANCRAALRNQEIVAQMQMFNRVRKV
ncbi:MAG: radical SAM protein [Candidatus Omnitrophota bacterium]